MKLIGWSFTLEDEKGREIEIKGVPGQGSYNQYGDATPEELAYTVSLCEAIIQQAEADGLIEKEI